MAIIGLRMGILGTEYACRDHKSDISELLKYEYELGHTVKEAIENINRAKGAGTVAQCTAYEWYSKFKSGNLTIEDNPRSGRPREVDRDAVVNKIG
ncbi:histone-lysine N-methyltransferase SETMAR [Ditylenchus destructor]|nr:histone-lysine N-methyltransferase SETMAR [Ditylenchus destructor]